MRDSEKNIAKVRRQKVKIFLKGDQFTPESVLVVDVADVALPTPDGRFFLVRNLTAGESRDEAVDIFVPVDQIRQINITSQQYWIHADKSRGEPVTKEELDKPEEKSQLIT